MSSKPKKTNKCRYASKLAIALLAAIFFQSFPTAVKADALVTSTLTGTVISSTQITLRWNDNLTDEKSYAVERKTDSGAFAIVSSFLGSGMTNYTDSAPVGHTYTYRVRVTDASNTNYIYTDELTVNLGDIVTPNSLIITPVSYNQIDLKWTYPDQKAMNTVIERKLENDTGWSTIARVGIGQNTYSDRTIASGFKYLYRVRQYYSDNVITPAYPTNGNGAYSLLFKPTGLNGFALSQKQIQLNWTDNSVETAFIIERRSPEEGVFKEIAVVPQNNNSYIDRDPSLKPDTTYSYRIKAVTGNTGSEYSDVINITTTFLKTPGLLTSTSVDGKSIRLEWQDYTENETGFEIWRRTGLNPVWEVYETMGRNATSFIDLDVSSQDTYTYKIRAKINDNSVYSDFSNETTVWTASIAAPGNLSYQVAGSNEIKLTWQDNSMTEAGFRVERKIGLAGSWYTIAYLEPNTVTYTDKWINNTDTYFYRIKVFDSTNSVNYSNETTVAFIVPDKPSNLEARAISDSEVELGWKDNSTNEIEFIIEAKQYYVFSVIARVSADTTAYTYKNIAPGRTLTFRVRAVTGTNQSEPSNEVSATTRKKTSYTDLGGVSWAVEAINNLASRNVFDAAAGSKFNPGQKMTRGEFCAVIIRSMELEKTAAGKFADLTSKDKFYREIMAAARLGIISADAGNKIYPARDVTREEAAAMLAAALKVKGTPLPEKDAGILRQFADYKTISPATADKLAAVCDAGILSGNIINGINYLQPGGIVTRAQAAVMAYKAINFKYTREAV